MDVVLHIPRQAEEIIEKLNSRGFEAYVVGGCVRDCVLGKQPDDWDITTSARPEQVKEIFGRTIDTGIKHGTVTIMRGRKGYEVTTFRIDGRYEDGRHPESVEFTSDLTEDLRRRDFTVNAMAYSLRTGLVDVFGGLKDLKEHRIRCVGNARDRFGEDALRILRALRFSAQLGFEIEEDTKNALKELAPNLLQVSRERVQTELTKLLLSGAPNTVCKVFEWGLASYVSKTFAGMKPEEISISPRLPAAKHMRWAACLRQLPAQKAVQVLKELKLDNDTMDRVKILVEWWDRPVGLEPAAIRRTMSRMPEESFDDLLTLKESILEGSLVTKGRQAMESGPTAESEQTEESDSAAEGERAETSDLAAEGGQAGKGSPAAKEVPARDLTEGVLPETKEDLAEIRRLTEEIRLRGDCISLKTLAVTGNDLIRAGMKPGREMGAVLGQLLDLVLEQPEKNTREALLREASLSISKKTT